MFRVEAANLAQYLAFDPARAVELEKLHHAMRVAAPRLKRYFHKGTPAGAAGMRMKMIGYGAFRYVAGNGEQVEWPTIGVALQKNYISVYIPLTLDRKPLVARHARTLNALRSADYNFSFERFDDLNPRAADKLFSDAARIIKTDPDNPVRCMQRQ